MNTGTALIVLLRDEPQYEGALNCWFCWMRKTLRACRFHIQIIIKPSIGGEGGRLQHPVMR